MSLLQELRKLVRSIAARRQGMPCLPDYRRRFRCLAIEALEDRVLLSYSFTLLADDGSFSLQGSSPSMNDPGTVAFHAGLQSGGEGVFTRDTEGHLGIISITSDLVSGFPIGGGINDAGTVSFGADLRAGGQAIFTGRGEALSRIADTGPDTPFSSFLGPAATINSDETVAFRATLKGSEQTGIFAGRAGETPHILYVTGGRFAALLYANIQRDGNQVVFRATLNTGVDGVFLGNGLTTTTIATTGDTYSAFTASVPNDAGSAAFLANLTAGGQAIVTGDGTQLTTIADTSGRFSSFFGNVGYNNGGQVVFTANLAAGGSGIFSVRDGVVEEIVGTGDALLDSTVTSFAAIPFAPRGLNNAGQLAFVANLADGQTVLVRADPEGAALDNPSQVVSLTAAINPTARESGSVLVGTTGPVRSPSIDTSGLSPARCDEGEPVPEKATGERSASVMASSDRPGGVHDQVFAELDLVRDMLSSSLALAG